MSPRHWTAAICPITLFCVHAQELPNLTVASHLVQIPVQAQDAGGRFVTSLEPEHFRIEENGIPRAIVSFVREDGPVSLHILLDVSGSMKGRLEPAVAAVQELVRHGYPGDEISLSTFAETRTPFGDTELALDRARALGPCGRTALWDAIDEALAQARREHRPREVILVVTDGIDTASRLTFGRLRNRAMESNAVLYAALLGRDSRRNHLSRWDLREIAGITGGRVFRVNRPRALAAEMERIGMRQRYVLFFQPHSGPAGRRKVAVSLTPSAGGRLRLFWRREFLFPEGE